MAGSYELPAAFHDHIVETSGGHLLSVRSFIWAENVSGARHDQPVAALFVIAARAFRREKIIPAVPLEYIGRFHVACAQPLPLRSGSRLQPVVVKLYGPYSRARTEAAPEQIFLPVVIDEQGWVY